MQSLNWKIKKFQMIIFLFKLLVYTLSYNIFQYFNFKTTKIAWIQ